jgi:3-phosphoshikimate 1-carboxyvinyltransferase
MLMTPETYAIHPSGAVCGTIRPPGSKSITNRALVCAALAEGESVLSGVLDCEDTQVMIAALKTLGIPLAHDPASATIRVTGCGGRFPVREADLSIANSGTSMRFLTAMLTASHGHYRLDGTRRMRERPIQDLLDALHQLGAHARSEFDNACPPVVIEAAGLPGGTARISGAISSQFLSGVLMASPYAAKPVEIVVVGNLVSKPYVEMTISLMESFGIAVRAESLQRFLIPAGRTYRGRNYLIEPDASAASYFFAAAAVTGGKVTVCGMGHNSLQGDVAFCDCLSAMGCDVAFGPDAITVAGRPLHGVQINMNAISDTVQTLAMVALFADGPTTITGVGHIRHKETDRIAALAAEIRKLGAGVEESSDGLRILPAPLHGAQIDTYDDHRMAMSFAIAGLRVPGVILCNPQCCAKTYPGFFTDLERLVGRSTDRG